MNKFLRGAVAPLALALVISSCAKDSDNNDNKNGYKEFPELEVVVASYVDNTVISTYADMKAGGKQLVDAVAKYKLDKTQINIEAACKAWQHTRKAWECSEAFLYGPAADEAIDPSLDSWPLDQNLLDQILKGSDPINQKALSNNVRGFHTLEYLLFREGKARNAADLSSRELEFLSAVTTGLYEDIENLHSLWSVGADAFGKGVKAQSPSAKAIEQLIDGITVITDEVGNAKIKDPYESKNVLDVESWYSWNSLTDFVNNIQGAENSYYGGYIVSQRAHSLQSFVKAQNPELDKELVAAFDKTKKAILAIGEPFRNNLHKDKEIKAAMEACGELTDLFTVKVKALVVY